MINDQTARIQCECAERRTWCHLQGFKHLHPACARNRYGMRVRARVHGRENLRPNRIGHIGQLIRSAIHTASIASTSAPFLSHVKPELHRRAGGHPNASPPPRTTDVSTSISCGPLLLSSSPTYTLGSSPDLHSDLDPFRRRPHQGRRGHSRRNRLRTLRTVPGLIC